MTNCLRCEIQNTNLEYWGSDDWRGPSSCVLVFSGCSEYLCNSTLLQLDLHIVPVLFELKPTNGLVLTLCWNLHTAGQVTEWCVSHSHEALRQTATLLRDVQTIQGNNCLLQCYYTEGSLKCYSVSHIFSSSQLLLKVFKKQVFKRCDDYTHSY